MKGPGFWWRSPSASVVKLGGGVGGRLAVGCVGGAVGARGAVASQAGAAVPSSGSETSSGSAGAVGDLVCVAHRGRLAGFAVGARVRVRRHVLAAAR